MIEEHEEQLTEAFRAFTKLERVLRHLIGEALSKHFGTLWSKQIPPAISERMQRKMDDMSDQDFGPERDWNLLGFADFSELISIVKYFWDEIFHAWFPDEQITFGLFEEIRNYRNALMHSTLLPKDCPTFISLCQGFTDQLESVSKKTVVELPRQSIPIDSQVSANQVQDTEDQESFQQKISNSLQEMTGLFEGERDALLENIQSRLNRCSAILLEQIRHKFISLPETDAKIDALARRLPPRRPKPPKPDWKPNASKWLKWATTSYLPYRYWMMINGQYDDEIEAMSIAYEDWLFDEYSKLLKKASHRFAFNSYQTIKKLLERNKIVLWVLVDNLPYFSQSILVKQLSEHGFRVAEMVRKIACIPSETSISRKSVLAGRLPNQLPEAVSEKSTILDAWQSRTHKRVTFLEKFNDLESVDQYQAELYIYVYTRLDDLWHTPAYNDFEIEEEIEVAMARLVARLSKAMTQLEQRDPASLVISTDHGAIYLHTKSERLSVPASATKDETYEKHRRFIRTSRPDALNGVEWFYLDKGVFHLHHNYAVARGWRYIERRPRGFTHGGLSPEETIVPMIICELGESEVERLLPSYEQASSPLRLGRPGDLRLRVRNPYRILIEDLEISLSDYGLTFPPLDIKPQLEVETEAVELQLPAKMPVEQDAVFVNLSARFIAGGQSRSHVTKLRIKIHQLFKLDLDDNFGEMFR
jgi:hypothetical protein